MQIFFCPFEVQLRRLIFSWRTMFAISNFQLGDSRSKTYHLIKIQNNDFRRNTKANRNNACADSDRDKHLNTSVSN
jgi:hypothetical protein